VNTAALADRIASRIIEAQARDEAQIRAVVRAVLHEDEIAAGCSCSSFCPVHTPPWSPDELEARRTWPSPDTVPASAEDDCG
jgi:hypothetical protein